MLEGRGFLHLIDYNKDTHRIEYEINGGLLKICPFFRIIFFFEDHIIFKRKLETDPCTSGTLTEDLKTNLYIKDS